MGPNTIVSLSSLSLTLPSLPLPLSLFPSLSSLLSLSPSLHPSLSFNQSFLFLFSCLASRYVFVSLFVLHHVAGDVPHTSFPVSETQTVENLPFHLRPHTICTFENTPMGYQCCCVEMLMCCTAIYLLQGPNQPQSLALAMYRMW